MLTITDDICTIPFKQVKNLIMVDVQLNGQQYPFLFDSGAIRSVVSEAHFSKDFFADIKQTTIKDVNTDTAKPSDSAAHAAIHTVQVELLQFANIELRTQEILLLDISHLETALECGPIFGLIGADMMTGCAVCLDYDRHELTFIKNDIFKSALESFTSDSIAVPFALEDHIPVIGVSIGAHTYRFGIDTGAEAHLIAQDITAELGDAFERTDTTDLCGAVSSSKVQRGIIKKVIIGGRALPQPQTAVTGNISHLNANRTLHIQGLLGYPFLAAQKTIISMDLKTLFLGTKHI